MVTSGPAKKGPRRKVLLVDDEGTIRRLVSATLGADEFQLLEAGTGDEALALIRKEHPAVVLLDIAMPGIDGFEVCRRIKTDPAMASTKVVMLTGKGDDESRKRALGVGADAYHAKPFSPIALLDTIYQFLR